MYNDVYGSMYIYIWYILDSHPLVLKIGYFNVFFVTLQWGVKSLNPLSIVPGELWRIHCGYPTWHVKGAGSNQTTTSFTSYRWQTDCNGSHLWTFIERSGPIFGCWFHGCLDSGIWTLACCFLAAGNAWKSCVWLLEISSIWCAQQKHSSFCPGVICPMVNTRAQAETLVAACRYAPNGERSWGPTRAMLKDRSTLQGTASNSRFGLFEDPKLVILPTQPFVFGIK